jgi:LytS/YehU family sensor histidine kinase
MATIKNNPYELLQREGISHKLLSEKSVTALEVYDQTYALLNKHANSKEIRENVEKAGKLTIEMLTADIDRIKKELKSENEETEEKEIKKAQSKKIIEKSAVVLDDLSECRERLKEDRKHKLESGEIPPRKKKTLVTRLRMELLKTVTLIPKNLKEDLSVIRRTQKALLNFLNELKSIWGMNKIKPIENDLKEKFKKLEDDASSPNE